MSADEKGYEETITVTRGAKGGMVVTVKVKDPVTKNTSSYALGTNTQALKRNRDQARSYAIQHLNIIQEDQS